MDSLVWFYFLFPQAEEQLRRVELERQQLEERQRREDEEKKQSIKQQETILNKKKARPKLSFSLGGRWPKKAASSPGAKIKINHGELHKRHVGCQLLSKIKVDPALLRWRNNVSCDNDFVLVCGSI